MIKNIFKHLKIVIKHKWLVFKFCCKVGIPWRGVVHDLSKFSPTEFGESVKYFAGVYSPIINARENLGFSKAWLHHKGRNKHHLEYWVDYASPIVAPVIPYKYILEKVCDDLSAGIVYNGKNWKQDMQYDYYTKKQRYVVVINPKIDNFLTETYLQVKENGINKTLTKKNMKQLYKINCIDDKTEYKYEFERGVWTSNANRVNS